jgi:hypothetical protein
MQNDEGSARLAALQWLARQLTWERQLEVLRRVNELRPIEPRKAA